MTDPPFFSASELESQKESRTPWRLLASSALKLSKALTDSSGAYFPLEARGQVYNGSYWSISPSSCTSTSCISYGITQFFARLEEWRSLERPFSKWPFVGKQKFSSSYFTTRIPNWIYSTYCSFCGNHQSLHNTKGTIKGHENQYGSTTGQSTHRHGYLLTKHIPKLRMDVP